MIKMWLKLMYILVKRLKKINRQCVSSFYMNTYFFLPLAKKGSICNDIYFTSWLHQKYIVISNVTSTSAHMCASVCLYLKVKGHLHRTYTSSRWHPQRYLTQGRGAPAEQCKVNNGHIGLDNCWTSSFTPHRVHTHADNHTSVYAVRDMCMSVCRFL